jgi:preprotein translocase subunit SecG
MPTLFFILIIIACVVLGLIVLVQNPKGGGLSGTFGGVGNQFMGVKQTTDVLEKGTWLFAGLIGLLCIVSVLFFRGGSSSSNENMLNNINTNAPAQQKTAPMTTPVLPQAADTTKK